MTITTHHAADHRSQSLTTITADAHREAWEREDLEFVMIDARDEDIALALGRTLYAVRAIRARIHAEGLEHVLATTRSVSDPLAFRATDVCPRCFCVRPIAASCCD